MQDQSQRLSALLGLELPPVALRFVDDAPPGVATSPPSDAPSACSLWRVAEKSTFYAAAERHHGCAVGTMVMGFPVDEVQDALGGVVTAMVECGYLSADEAAAIPTMPAGHGGIVYGPLAEADTTPDVVVFWVDARQAMLMNEAAGTAAWTSASPMTVTGRPGCAVLPRAIRHGAPMASTGCIGMRTFTAVPDHLMLVALPGPALDGFLSDLDRTTGSNESMFALYSSMLG